MVEAKKGRGCFFYGCLTMAAVVILGIIAIYVGGRVFTKYALNTWTATNSVVIAPVTLPHNQGGFVSRKVENFLADLKAGRATGPLELTSDELDYFIRNSKDWAHMRKHLRVFITNSHVQAEISFPLEAIRPSLKGRFLNGTAELTPKISNGALVIDLHSVKAKGQPVPERMLAGIRQNLSWKPEAGELESIEIRDDKIVITPKINAPEAVKSP